MPICWLTKVCYKDFLGALNHSLKQIKLSLFIVHMELYLVEYTCIFWVSGFWLLPETLEKFCKV